MELRYWTDHTYTDTSDTPLFITRAGRELQIEIRQISGYGEFQLLLVTQGMGIFERGDETLLLPTGTVMLLPPKTPLFYRPVSKLWETTWLTFIGSEAEALITLPYGIYQARNAAAIENAISEIMHLPKERRQSKGRHILRELLFSLPSYLVQPALTFSKSSKNEAFLKMTQYIHTNFAEKITLEDLMRVSGCGKTKVNDLFRRNVRMSPMQYVILLRKMVAEEYLKSRPDLSIGEIAKVCGFGSLSYFDRCFTCMKTPSKFRKHFLSITSFKP